MIGLIDNFDSFTYNLVSLVQALGEQVVVLNHQTLLSTCLSYPVKAWILGPGPGGPAQTGISSQLIGTAPILGICLGHQLIGHYFGAQIKRHLPCHGKRSQIFHQEEYLFKDIPSPFWAVRYHSLIVTDIPKELQITATTEDGLIMGLRHRHLPIEGVQFHPDSIATEYGIELIRNFLTCYR